LRTQFCAYRPNAWKFELYETFRKLIMVAMMLFVYEGKPLQVFIKTRSFFPRDQALVLWFEKRVLHPPPELKL
jgi:hypothetical protein